MFADKPRSLGNEQDSTGRAVIDILRHLRGLLSRQIGPYSGNQRCRDQASGLEDIGRARLADTFGTFGGRPGAAFDKGAACRRKCRTYPPAEIGRAQVWTPVTNAPRGCRLLREKKNITKM